MPYDNHVPLAMKSANRDIDNEALVSHICRHCNNIIFKGDIFDTLHQLVQKHLNPVPSNHVTIRNLQGFSYRMADKNVLYSDWRNGTLCPLLKLILLQHPELPNIDRALGWPPILTDLRLKLSVGFGQGNRLQLQAHLHFDTPEQPRSTLWKAFPLPDADWLQFGDLKNNKVFRAHRTEIVGPPNLHVASEAAMAQAREWLAICRFEPGPHSRCQSTARYAMPRRLVELDSATKVRVVEVQQDIPYVVLSYCWGGDQLKLLSSNTSTFTSQEGPELLELSQSVRDAVCVTWNLGLRYLWVDALCIIQDDGTDLASELAKMADIYEGALFTIAAGSVARCSEGFLHQRRLQDTFRISIEDTQGYQGSLLLQNTRVKFAAEALDPIVLRAWTFQEVLLSSRLLYFGLEKLEWSCAAHGGDLSDGGSPSHIHFPRYRWRQLPEMGHTSSVARVESYWANVLTDYTKRALTVPSDKLVALSAVAQRFAERARGGSYLTYLAGIWLEHLPFGLLWYNDNDDDASESQSHPTSRASSWRAPSWSWASMDGPLNFFRLANGDSGQSKLDMNGPLEIINYRVQLKFDNAPYAGVVKAELELTGLLKHVNLDYHSGALEIKLDPDGQLDVGTWPEEIYWDEPPSPDNLEKYSRVLLLEIISPWRNNDLDGEPNEYIMWTLILAEKENGMCYPFDC